MSARSKFVYTENIVVRPIKTVLTAKEFYEYVAKGLNRVTLQGTKKRSLAPPAKSE